MKVDHEVDFHGSTAREMRWALDDLAQTSAWRGWRRVRVIHGNGEVLRAYLRDWCHERGVSWSPEPRNPGSTILHPFRSQLPPPPRLDPPKPVKPRRTLARPINPAAKPEELKAARDLMKQEFERLGEQTPETLRHRKRGHGAG